MRASERVFGFDKEARERDDYAVAMRITCCANVIALGSDQGGRNPTLGPSLATQGMQPSTPDGAAEYLPSLSNKTERLSAGAASAQQWVYPGYGYAPYHLIPAVTDHTGG
jgi:hypothetical protein